MPLKLRHVAPAAVLVPTLALTFACSRTPEPGPPPPAKAQAQVRAEAPAAPVAYRCEDGRALTAAYEGNAATVTLDGRTYRLATAISASGARYAGGGVQWWTKGPDDGRLSTLKPAEDVATDPGVACTRVGTDWPPVEPPAPGTPGGLPDDRTPISEAPFTPDSPQGAADVVQTYYAHLGQKAYAKAWALWRDGGRASGYPTAQAFAASFDRYAQYDAQVGAPGAPEGAAGSVYVSVPVVIYGRLRTGAEVHEKGEAVLRRANDVPGADAGQRVWRIARISTRRP